MMAVRYALMAIASAAVASAQSLTDLDFTTTPTATSTRSHSAFWTVTARYAEQVTASAYTYYDGEVVTDTYTATRTIKDSVTPTASPYTIEYNSDYDYYTDVEFVYAYYTTSVVPESDFVPESTYDYYSTATTSSTSTSKVFFMPVTMTAPASCPTPFTVTTTASVYIPSQVTPQITPTSVETDTTTGNYGSIVYEYETWYLSAGAAPFRSTTDYYYSYYIASCSTPPISRSTGSSSSGGPSYYDDDNCYSYFCGTPYLTVIIVVASIIPALFLLGFIESWFWFRRLMMGKSAMRFGTVSWILLSLWVLCFTRMQDRRSAEDQKLLAEKWKNMGSGAAFKAWWKYGFRHRYPEELLGQYCKTTVGIVPPGQPLHPAMAQTPGTGPAAPGQVFYYGPPPPGWVQGPNGAFIPPQGYVYPPPQQAFNGNIAKDGSLVSNSPVSVMGYPPPPQQTGNAVPMPQAPQPVHSAQGVTSPSPVSAPSAPPSPPPQGPLPTAPPQIPSINVAEAPAEPAAPPPPKADPGNRDLY
ncbi:hypothetical protein yc1106_06112 [Curvularia clavata]|uniref:Uncharacterized protein n=1 Tax=Curvularia clavata TaxID=95742 RepID=A0A9Q8ZDR8_CURCL|nr:hypothetical protein yc1106_06112 [Curvularia clavata]